MYKVDNLMISSSDRCGYCWNDPLRQTLAFGFIIVSVWYVSSNIILTTAGSFAVESVARARDGGILVRTICMVVVVHNVFGVGGIEASRPLRDILGAT